MYCSVSIVFAERLSKPASTCGGRLLEAMAPISASPRYCNP